MDVCNRKEDRFGRRDFFSLGAGLSVAALAALASARPARASNDSQPSLTNIISVLDFGADPTGVNDSTVAIQDAIHTAMNPAYVAGRDFVYPAAQREAMVLFPTGKYKITDTLHITGAGANARTNNISLIGMRAAIVQHGVGKDIIRFVNTEHCIIRDLYLSASAHSGHGIRLQNAIRTLLDNVEIYLVGGNCLYADEAFFLSADDCVFALPGPNQYAVHHYNHMNNVSYHHCRFVGSSAALNRGGLYTADATTGGVGVIAIIACDFSASLIGLKLHAGSNFYVANCWFEANQTAVQWGHAGGEDAVTGSWSGPTWPQAATLENCYFVDDKDTHAPVLLDIQRGTNLRINNPIFTGNGQPASSANRSVAIRLSSDANLQRVVIDHTPYMQNVAVAVEDPARKLQRVRLDPY